MKRSCFLSFQLWNILPLFHVFGFSLISQQTLNDKSDNTVKLKYIQSDTLPLAHILTTFLPTHSLFAKTKAGMLRSCNGGDMREACNYYSTDSFQDSRENSFRLVHALH